jgi:hypothetical protein
MLRFVNGGLMKVLITCSLLLAAVSPAAFGGAISIQSDDVTGWFSDGLIRTVGYQFTANSTFQVNRLGFVDANQDGLIESHGVAIWELDGVAPIVTGTVASGVAAPLEGMFRWVSIPDVQLNAGGVYIIVGSYAGTELWTWSPPCCWDTVGVTDVLVDPRISLAGRGYGRAAVGTVSLDVYPSWVGWGYGDNTRDAFIGPNFDFAGDSPIPEPGTFGVVAAGLAALILGLRWKRRSV